MVFTEVTENMPSDKQRGLSVELLLLFYLFVFLITGGTDFAWALENRLLRSKEREKDKRNEGNNERKKERKTKLFSRTLHLQQLINHNNAIFSQMYVHSLFDGNAK